MMFGTREWFDYRRCHACGTLQIETIPADLERHYPPTYYSLTSTAPPAVERSAPTWLIRERVRPHLLGGRHGWRRALGAIDRCVAIPADVAETVLPILARARLQTFDDPILDVGSGAHPARLAAFRRAGFRRLLAIDPFVVASRYQGVPVRRAAIGDIEGSWRLVMFHHSFEHVEDPQAELAHAARLLENGGYLLIRTPVMGSGMWERFGTDWVELDAPRHLFLFTGEGLIDLAQRNGFELVDVESDAGWWDLVASEQYRRDLGMFEPTSWFVDEKTSGFDPAELLEFRRQSREMNERGTAGRAAFWFRRVVARGPGPP
jgi:SAM-dependent methyltransferase